MHERFETDPSVLYSFGCLYINKLTRGNDAIGLYLYILLEQRFWLTKIAVGKEPPSNLMEISEEINVLLLSRLKTKNLFIHGLHEVVL